MAFDHVESRPNFLKSGGAPVVQVWRAAVDVAKVGHVEHFGGHARINKQITPQFAELIGSVQVAKIDVDEVVQICHGSPFDEDAYIFDELDAVRALKVANRPLCLFGHTHYPVTFELSEDTFDNVGAGSAPQTQIQMKAGCKYLINPGSVGQPRDGDPRAAYALVDTKLGRIELYRVKYPVEEAQAKVIKAGLPDVLAQRLAVGR